MKELTISEKRNNSVIELAKRENPTPTAENIATARRLMTSYYRLCGLCETNLYLTNNDRTCNLKSTAESEQRERRWYKRLESEFKAHYGLKFCSYGYFPTIVEHDGGNDAVGTYFYNR